MNIIKQRTINMCSWTHNKPKNIDLCNTSIGAFLHNDYQFKRDI